MPKSSRLIAATLLLLTLVAGSFQRAGSTPAQHDSTQPAGDLFSGFPVHYLGETAAENGFELTLTSAARAGDVLTMEVQLGNASEYEINLLLALKLYSTQDRMVTAQNLDGTESLAPGSTLTLALEFTLPASPEAGLGAYRLVYTPRGYSDVIFVHALTERPQVVNPPPPSSSSPTLPAEIYGTTGDPWKMLVLIYKYTDTDYVDLNGQTKHLTATMPDQDITNMQTAFRNLPHLGVVYNYSGTAAELEATFVVVNTPLTSLEPIYNGYWPSPAVTQAELDRYGPQGKYDSVIVFWQASHPITGQSIPDGGGWGWGYWPGETGANGMTYASIYNISWVWTTPNQACRGEVFLHEWLHGVTGFYSSKGVPFNVNDLHGAEQAGYSQDAGGCWETWLRDYMRGLVYENGQRKALVPSLSWYQGSITTWSIQGWRAEYFNNETLSGIPVLVRDDAQINFAWESNSPHPLVSRDHFSARWTKTKYFAPGLYRFDATRDDGMRIWVDDVLILDKWFHGYTSESVDYFIPAGTHKLRVETFEIDGWASAILTITSQTLSAQFTSAPGYDGWIAENAETGNTGLSMDSSAATFNLGDESSDRQLRSILSFYTNSLPENAVLVSATVKIRPYGALVGNNDPFSWGNGLKADICRGTFGTVLLQLTDFNYTSASCALGAGTFAGTPVNGWYSLKLPGSALSRINKAGWTQLRLRFYTDDNDDGAADYWRFYSGNAPSYQPLLIIKYYLQ